MSDVQELKATLKKLGTNTSKRYDDPELRAQIATVTAGLLASGVTWWAASKKLGISFYALKKICEARPLAATNGSTNGHANGRVHLTVHAANGHRVEGLAEPPLALVTKDGHRVEGLDVKTLAALLARL